VTDDPRSGPRGRQACAASTGGSAVRPVPLLRGLFRPAGPPCVPTCDRRLEMLLRVPQHRSPPLPGSPPRERPFTVSVAARCRAVVHSMADEPVTEPRRARWHRLAQQCPYPVPPGQARHRHAHQPTKLKAGYRSPVHRPVAGPVPDARSPARRRARYRMPVHWPVVSQAPDARLAALHRPAPDGRLPARRRPGTGCPVIGPP
jgi:hypothetical protein